MKKVSDKMNGGTKKKLYPKVEQRGLVETSQLIKSAVTTAGVSEGSVKGVIAAITDAAVSYMSLGHSVRIEGLGILLPRLKLIDEKDSEVGDEGEVRHYGSSVEVTGISLIPDKGLIQKLNSACRPQRIEAVDTSFATERTTLTERREKARKFMEENGKMSIRDYAALVQLPYSTAGRELRQWEAEDKSELTHELIGSNKFYKKKE